MKPANVERQRAKRRRAEVLRQSAEFREKAQKVKIAARDTRHRATAAIELIKLLRRLGAFRRYDL